MPSPDDSKSCRRCRKLVSKWDWECDVCEDWCICSRACRNQLNAKQLTCFSSNEDGKDTFTCLDCDFSDPHAKGLVNGITIDDLIGIYEASKSTMDKATAGFLKFAQLDISQRKTFCQYLKYPPNGLLPGFTWKKEKEGDVAADFSEVIDTVTANSGSDAQKRKNEIKKAKLQNPLREEANAWRWGALLVADKRSADALTFEYLFQVLGAVEVFYRTKECLHQSQAATGCLFTNFIRQNLFYYGTLHSVLFKSTSIVPFETLAQTYAFLRGISALVKSSDICNSLLQSYHLTGHPIGILRQQVLLSRGNESICQKLLRLITSTHITKGCLYSVPRSIRFTPYDTRIRISSSHKTIVTPFSIKREK